MSNWPPLEDVPDDEIIEYRAGDVKRTLLEMADMEATLAAIREWANEPITQEGLSRHIERLQDIFDRGADKRFYGICQ